MARNDADRLPTANRLWVLTKLLKTLHEATEAGWLSPPEPVVQAFGELAEAAEQCGPAVQGWPDHIRDDLAAARSAIKGIRARWADSGVVGFLEPSERIAVLNASIGLYGELYHLKTLESAEWVATTRPPVAAFLDIHRTTRNFWERLKADGVLDYQRIPGEKNKVRVLFLDPKTHEAFRDLVRPKSARRRPKT